MDHAEIVSHLADLEKHPGWKIVTARYAEGVQQVVDQALDQATDDPLTLKLKHAHGLLVEASPEKLRETLQAHHKQKAVDEAREAIQATATDGPS